ncbi:hypothetical protein F5Y10DRAFT_85035 [Nemania abortiva]|nr:hypothetical protein F5Y10DRAFT_85035 [Nemania abortiva]
MDTMAPTLPAPTMVDRLLPLPSGCLTLGLRPGADTTPPASTVTLASEASLPVQAATQPLTTIFTPPPGCEGRYYIQTEANEDDTEPCIFSNTGDRLYRSCQPDPKAYDNYYSPGACPSNMAIAAVSSSASDGAAGTTYTDICCQSGFAWDSQSCYSAVPTPTMVLVAPEVSTRDEHVLVSHVQAWHPPVMAVWQTTDLPLFPTDVMSQKSQIAENGWPPQSTSSVTPTRSESSRPSTEPGNADIQTGALSVPVVIVIGVMSVVVFCFVVLLLTPKHPRDEPDEPHPVVISGPTHGQSGNTWSIEVGPPPEEPRPRVDRQRKEGQAKVKPNNESASNPMSGHGDQEQEDVILPAIDRAVPPLALRTMQALIK